MTGSIDNINEMVFPFSRYSCGNNGDTAFTFLGHPVGNGCAVIDVAQTVGFAGIKQNPLGGGSFTSIDMGDNANISIALERKVSHR